MCGVTCIYNLVKDTVTVCLEQTVKEDYGSESVCSVYSMHYTNY